MKRTATWLLATSPLLLAACATGGHPALVEANAPHARVEQLLQANIDDEHVRTTLVRIDGEGIHQGERRRFLLEPGRHTLGFTLDVESLKQYEVGRGDRYPDPSASAARVNEKTVTVNLEAGESYTFGATMEDFAYAKWEPFVVETDELD